MNLHDILSHPYRNLLTIISFLMVIPLPVQGSVIYQFQSAPIEVGILQRGTNHEVQTTHGFFFGAPFPGSVSIGDRLTASLTFASPLERNSTIPIHLSAESGGFDFLPGPNQGNVEAYSADFHPHNITSNINEYWGGDGGTVSVYDRYSSLDGDVTTDASGNISAWVLNFTLLRASGGSDIFIDHGPIPPTMVSGLPSEQDAVVSISSNPALPVTVSNMVEFNGMAQAPADYGFTGADTAFEDPGPIQYRYWTEGPGSFTTTGTRTVPEPGTLGLMMAGLGLLGWQRRSLRR